MAFAKLGLLVALLALPAPAQPWGLRSPSPELSAKIRQWAAEWENDHRLGSWPHRLGRERGVYLLHGNSAYLWYLTPEGQVLTLDTDRFGHRLEVEELPQAALNAVAQASHNHPELRELLPLRPEGARDCPDCRGTGQETSWGSCSCHGLGWRRP